MSNAARLPLCASHSLPGLALVVLLVGCGSTVATPEPRAEAIPPSTAASSAGAPSAKPPTSASPYAPPAITLDRPTNLPTNKTEAELVSDIAALESALAKTKVTDPDHFARATQLAEAYCALEIVAKGKPPLATKAHSRGVDLLTMNVEKHDTEPRLDETLFLLATEYEHESRDKALATYLKLLKMRPMSKLVPWAYIAFGNLYFEDALQGKIDWSLPREAYARAIQGSSQPSRVTAYATFRLGFVHWFSKDANMARSVFDDAIKLAKQVGAPDIEAEAQRARDSV